MSVHWFSTSVLFLGGTVAISKVVAKVKELWTQRVTHFNTEEEMDHFFKNYGNISIGLILDQTDLITFSYTIKLPYESIPGYDTMYEKNQGIKINVLLIFTSSFITNILSGGSRLRNFPPIQNNWKSLS